VRKEARGMAKGICKVCRNKPACVHPRPSRGVVNCDDFEGSPARASLRLVRPEAPRARPAFGGLCASCGRAADCTYSRGRAGSVLCEEYEAAAPVAYELGEPGTARRRRERRAAEVSASLN